MARVGSDRRFLNGPACDLCGFGLVPGEKTDTMAQCERCGRAPLFGQNRPFSLKATKRQFLVNVQRVSVYSNGHRRAAYLCSRCLRTTRKSA